MRRWPVWRQLTGDDRAGLRDAARSARHEDLRPRTEAGGQTVADQQLGFFTDSSICIGCKACEVACKQWNDVPVDGLRFLNSSYDNTGELGANAWRHVQFIERRQPDGGVAWLMNSDVCKHCKEAACLDVCPTGAIFHTEFDTVVVQEDVCNGCGYCIPACPFGVLSRREGVASRPETNGTAQKCTLCYDRLRGGLEPACAQACPTGSIQFGPVSQLRARAHQRLETLRAEGRAEARLYLGEESDNGVGGTGSMFLLLDRPEAYRLPEHPVVPTRRLRGMWAAAAAAAGLALAGVGLALGAGRR
jgi:formate dehydrogenase iron-sulfur subunit